MTRVAINGFGRIGRQCLKALIERHPEVEIVAVNDLADPKMNALLFKHDTNYGTYKGNVSATADALLIDDRKIKVLQERDPAKLPWKELAVDVVIESTGFFTDGTKAKAHLAVLGGSEPDMPPFDAAKYEPMPEVEIVPADEGDADND